VTETAAPRRLSTPRVPRSGCLPSCHAGLGVIPAPGHARFLDWFRSMTRAPFSPRSRRYVRQHVMRSTPRPASPRRLALRLGIRDDARCVGPTSAISLLVSVPAPRRFRTCHLLAQLHDSGRWPDARQGHSLRRVARDPRKGSFTAMGVVFPSWCVRTEPLTPLSPPSWCRDRSHDHDSPRESPRSLTNRFA
jgi:hypothetical protein